MTKQFYGTMEYSNPPLNSCKDNLLQLQAVSSLALLDVYAIHGTVIWCGERERERESE